MENDVNKDDALVNDALKSFDKEFAETNKHTVISDDSNVTSDEGINTEPIPEDADINEIPLTDTEEIKEETTVKKKSLSNLLKPKHAVNLIDILIPAILVYAFNFFGYRLIKKDIQLNKDEKETLQPFVEDFLNEIDFNLDNPYYNLLFGLSLVYGSKIIDVLPDVNKGRKKEIDIEETDLSPEAKFEQEYNVEVEKVMNEKGKGTIGARKWLADNEPEKIKHLMNKYGIFDDKYLMYGTIYKKEKQQKQFEIKL